LIKGVGWVGSGPFMCGKADLDGTDKSIFDFSMNSAKELAGKGEIDPLENIKGAPVW